MDNLYEIADLYSQSLETLHTTRHDFISLPWRSLGFLPHSPAPTSSTVLFNALLAATHLILLASSFSVPILYACTLVRVARLSRMRATGEPPRQPLPRFPAWDEAAHTAKTLCWLHYTLTLVLFGVTEWPLGLCVTVSLGALLGLAVSVLGAVVFGWAVWKMAKENWRRMTWTVDGAEKVQREGEVRDEGAQAGAPPMERRRSVVDAGVQTAGDRG